MTLRDCRIFGASVWRLRGTPKEQKRLNITNGYELNITVKDLQAAQFIY